MAPATSSTTHPQKSLFLTAMPYVHPTKKVYDGSVGVKIVHEGPQASAPASEDAPGFGLGDAVEIAAKPIAEILGIKDCLPCERRKQALNAASARAGAGIRRLFRRRPDA